jgi:oligopeptide transport system permease protein
MSDQAPAASLAEPKRGRSLRDDALDRLKANKAAMASIALIIFMTIACFLGPLVSPHAFDAVYPNFVKVPASLEPYPKAEEIEGTLESSLRRARLSLESWSLEGSRLTLETRSTRGEIDPRLAEYLDRSDSLSEVAIAATTEDKMGATFTATLEHQYFLFGTDANGRDLLTRTLIAGRVSIIIGLLATFVALLIGVTYGSIAGYVGGRVDMLLMRVVDILYSLPFIFFVILLVVFFGRNFILMFIAVGAVEWLDMARIVRGQAISLRRQEYVQAAQAMGVDGRGILRRHIVPNLLGPVVIYMTLMVPRVILLESFLSFLGLGVQEPMTSWGVLISEGSRNIQGSPWMLIFPSIFLTATLFALNFIGDGLRDALDPKER